MKSGKTAKDVDAYLDKLPIDKRKVLEKLRKVIKETAPEAEEKISYGMPGYSYYGMLVYFAAFKEHLSFFPGAAVVKKFEKELKGFETSKGTIRFSVEKTIPLGLVKRIVKERMKQNELKRKSK